MLAGADEASYSAGDTETREAVHSLHRERCVR